MFDKKTIEEAGINLNFLTSLEVSDDEVDRVAKNLIHHIRSSNLPEGVKELLVRKATVPINGTEVCLSSHDPQTYRRILVKTHTTTPQVKPTEHGVVFKHPTHKVECFVKQWCDSDIPTRQFNSVVRVVGSLLDTLNGVEFKKLDQDTVEDQPMVGRRTWSFIEEMQKRMEV